MRPRLSLLVAAVIALVATLVCHQFRQIIYPGPGDFNWALSTASALVGGRDPYDFTPTALMVPYPLPVALFGLPFVGLPGPWAGALFFGLSSGLLAYGILRRSEPWRLLVFLTFPYLYALLFAQWSPLVAASWFFPLLAPLLVCVKPHIALPVALNRLTWRGALLAAAVLLGSLIVAPLWPWRWLAMLGEYESMIPLLALPWGPLLLLTLWWWRDERARLLFGMSLLPLRGAYDLTALWLVPHSLVQMLILVALSWAVPLYDFNLGLSVRPAWVVPVLFVPAAVMVAARHGGHANASQRGVTSRTPRQEIPI
ncbi:MAG TPA: hypothetical protein PKD53_05215 [Chloroflexaceae bacterium]|nr:hypothetical protein [Chloroflexaceae bacterium]